GTGRSADPPEDDPEYRRGYLCGMIRGDGHLGSHGYIRRGRAATVHRFRLALVDLEALQRTRRYLSDLGVATTEFLFQRAVAGRRELTAIRTQPRERVVAIQHVVAW